MAGGDAEVVVEGFGAGSRGTAHEQETSSGGCYVCAADVSCVCVVSRELVLDLFTPTPASYLVNPPSGGRR